MDGNKARSAHILLVEDNEGDILLTKEAFEDSKVLVQLSVVKNGKDAMDFLLKNGKYENAKKPDLILLDINLPIYNGHQILKKIKSNDVLKRIPVVILTTSSNPRDIDKAYENQCNSYVKKPIQLNDFFDAILKIENFWLQLSKYPSS